MNHYQLLNIIEKINIIIFNKKYESLSTFKYNRKNKFIKFNKKYESLSTFKYNRKNKYY